MNRSEAIRRYMHQMLEESGLDPDLSELPKPLADRVRQFLLDADLLNKDLFDWGGSHLPDGVLRPCAYCAPYGRTMPECQYLNPRRDRTPTPERSERR